MFLCYNSIDEGGDRVPVTILLIAVSLAMDAFAVSVSCGISVPGFGVRQAARVGLWFGLFQFLMPLAGWALGTGVSGCIRAVDHWVAFALLAFIGGRMVAGALEQSCGGKGGRAPSELTRRRLCLLAVATSIDALAVGVSMAFLQHVNILWAALVIGGVAFAFSLAGGLLGRRLGCLFQKRAELAGGLVLIGIGFKILGEHLG